MLSKYTFERLCVQHVRVNYQSFDFKALTFSRQTFFFRSLLGGKKKCEILCSGILLSDTPRLPMLLGVMLRWICKCAVYFPLNNKIKMLAVRKQWLRLQLIMPEWIQYIWTYSAIRHSSKVLLQWQYCLRFELQLQFQYKLILLASALEELKRRNELEKI